MDVYNSKELCYSKKVVNFFRMWYILLILELSGKRLRRFDLPSADLAHGIWHAQELDTQTVCSPETDCAMLW